jgi:hypothetical protein
MRALYQYNFLTLTIDLYANTEILIGLPVINIGTTNTAAGATRWVLNSIGQLITSTGDRVYYSNTGSDAILLLFSEFGGFGDYVPAFLQLGCGPLCPATTTGSSGTIVLPATDAPYNSLGLCNDSAEFLINGRSGCSGGGNSGYVDALTYIVV